MTDKSSYIGKQIGNYRIVAELKSGSFGSVYQGKHLIFEDDPIVAIKLLYADLSSPQEHNQFIQEARLLKKLSHPHILPILDAGIHNDVPYLVMEYISRGALRGRLNQQLGQPLTIEESITVLTQIGQALHHAHQHEIVHCDLKPENILINDKGGAILADFGIATVLTAARTRRIRQAGTPAYMAPEQFEGIISMKSDQYALGCIAYELMTGRKPFIVPHPSIQSMQYQHAKVDPIPPTHFNSFIPIHIEQAIMKALAKQRADRHADVPTFISSFQKPATLWLQENSTLFSLNSLEETDIIYEQVNHHITTDTITNSYSSPKSTNKTADPISPMYSYSQLSQDMTNERKTGRVFPSGLNRDKSFIKILHRPSKNLAIVSIGLILLIIMCSFGLFSIVEGIPKSIPKDKITTTPHIGINADVGRSPATTNTSLSDQTPTVSLTPAPDANFSWCTSACTSKGFIIEYPNGWNQAQTNDKTGVQFLNPSSQDQYAAFKAPPIQGTPNASDLVDVDLQNVFVSQTGYTPPTSKSVTTIGSEAWTYAIAYYKLNGQKERVEVFATIHLKKGYVIELQANDSQFDTVNTRYFTIMIARFKFQIG